MEFTYQYLTTLAQQGESETVEFKKSTAQLKRACETICAFLNGNGGTVLIGVTDDGRILGQDSSDKTRREIGNELAKITPVPDFQIHAVTVPNSNKKVFIIHITTDSTKRPYLYENRAYIRIQTDTLPMPREYLQQLTLNNAQSGYQWEDQPLPEVTLNDIDTTEVLATVNEGILNGRIPEATTITDPWLALQRLGLINQNHITAAAIVLFGKKTEDFFFQCLLRMGRFKGVEKTELIDNKQIRGNVFELIHAAIAFAQTYLPIASTFSENTVERNDKPFFPFTALREAIVNAICHRDYTNPSGSVSFAIFDDRIEIWSYGLLPSGISIGDLTHMNQSVPRNHRIANVLYYHKLFESWGRGIQLIIKECTQANHPTPFYTVNTGGILLTMPFKEVIGAPRDSSSSFQQTVQLNEYQEEILTKLTNSNGLSTTELLKLMTTSPSERWLRNNLNQLQKLGFIEARGKTAARKWFMIRK